MPHEIADSDDEFEIELPLLKSSKIVGQDDAPPSTEEQDPKDPPDLLLNVDFDTFLSPTQRISSYDGNHDTTYEVNTLSHLDSSTDRFLNEVAPVLATSSIAPAESLFDGGRGEMNMGGEPTKKEKTSKKRSRTQHDDGSSARDNSSARKRTKTYTGAASNGMSGAQMEFQAMINGSGDQVASQPDRSKPHGDASTTDIAELVSIEERTQYTEPLELSLGLSVSNNNTDGHTEIKDLKTVAIQQYTSHQPYTPSTSFFGANLHGGTTSRSSMGNYQSFTIDPNALNMDYNKINPFGSLTQASLDDTEETKALAGIFRKNTSGSGSDPEMLMNNMQEMQTSPESGSHGVVAPEQLVAQEEQPQGSPSFSPITNPDDDNPDLEAVIPQHDLNEAAKAAACHVETVDELSKPPPPKKRGRKPKQKKADETAVVMTEDMDELQMDELHTARAIRASTVDSVSNISEISQATTGSKAGKGRKSKKTEMAPPEVLSKKLPSSDLGLDNKEVIGLSPERYVPRPSKRRGRAEPEPTLDAASANESSQHAPAQDIIEKETPAKGKKGRKSKVKRAKTSAAAILARNSDFLDDEEKEEAKEVMFVDERPAKVKFQPLPELSPDRKLKKEIHTEKSIEDDEDFVKSAKRSANFTIDVPVLAKSDDHEELPPPVPEPKKRGRKKKVVEEMVEEPAPQAEEHQMRSALAEKDVNARGNKAKSPKSSQNAKLAEEEHQDVDKENSITKTYEESPENASDPAKSVSTPISKPAHSPLKPPSSTTSLFNARTRIGLSKRHSIPSLLRRVDRNKERPKAIERKEKLNKRQLEEKEQERIAKEEAEAEGREYVPPDLIRGKDGLLVEWDF